jgi:hypothetical protein
MQWLITQFNELRNQIDDKQDKDFVRQFGISANAWGGYMGIGQKILNELVRRADSTAPLRYLDAVNLAERFASQEIEVLRAEGKAIRGSPENTQTPRAAKVYQVQNVPERKPENTQASKAAKVNQVQDVPDGKVSAKDLERISETSRFNGAITIS